MKIIRIKFKKDATVRFISHLDMMKAFQRAVRRAGLEAEYSHGFNPQMQMVFGAPLSLGFTSEAEFADLTFVNDYEPSEVVGKLNQALPDGLMVLDAGERKVKTNIMADIKAAGYTFKINPELKPDKIAGIIDSAPSLPVDKTRKGKTKTIDVRKLIKEVSGDSDRLVILVSAGNQNNLNPRLLVEALTNYLNIEIEGSGYNRTEQYVEREGHMVSPLDQLALEAK